MPNTISNLLIGIGFEFDKKSQSQVSSGIDGVKSKALQLSKIGLGMAAAGGGALSALTFDFADAADKMGKFSEVYGGTVGEIQALGNAFIKQGGDLDSFLGQLKSVREFQAQLRVGNTGFIQDAKIAGVDTDAIINAKTALEAYLSLADSVQASSDLGRINIARAVGGDESSIRLLSQGREEIERQMAAQMQLFNLTKEQTRQAAEFNDAWEDIKTSIVGAKAELATFAMPSMTEWIKDINEGLQLLRQYPDQIGSIIGGATFDAVNDTISAAAGVSFDDIAGGGELHIGGETLTPSAMSGVIDRSFVERSDLSPVISSDRLTMDAIKQESARPSVASITIENKVVLDGKVIDSRIDKRTQELNGEAVQNLQSSTDR